MVKKSIRQTSLLNKNTNIAIIGAGASGLLSSIVLARSGFSVTVFEKNTKIGRKILATGNGKCNISNKNITADYFYTTDINFINLVLNNFNHDKFKEFFKNIGLEIFIDKNNKIFPITQQASSVVNLLEYEAKKLNIKFILSTTIKNIEYKKDKFYLYSKDTKQNIYDKLIIATGSFAYKKLGSSNSGYDFARYFNHNINKPFPSLVQLKSNDKEIKKLSGLKISVKVDVIIDKRYSSSARGDILFTNYGLSGNAILEISRDISYAISIGIDNIVVIVDIFPNISKEVLHDKLFRRVKNSSNKDKYFWLEGFVNNKLIRYIVDNCGISQKKNNAMQLNKKDIMKLVYFLKKMSIKIDGTKGFDTAEVSAGGIDISDIEYGTMQSKNQKDLYFVGEVLDVDGKCGGYNLHWAWASGYTCAQNIIKNRSN